MSLLTDAYNKVLYKFICLLY